MRGAVNHKKESVVDNNVKKMCFVCIFLPGGFKRSPEV